MSAKRARLQSTTAQIPQPIRKVLLYRGLIARVARQLGLSHTQVTRVARGERTSRRVIAALLAEIERIERESSKKAA